MAVSKRMFESVDLAEQLAEYMEQNSGYDLHNYSKMIREDLNEEYSAKAQNWVKGCVDSMMKSDSYDGDKAKAFKIAWSQWKKKQGGKK
jgi:hypothetical protein